MLHSHYLHFYLVTNLVQLIWLGLFFTKGQYSTGWLTSSGLPDEPPYRDSLHPAIEPGIFLLPSDSGQVPVVDAPDIIAQHGGSAIRISRWINQIYLRDTDNAPGNTTTVNIPDHPDLPGH
jgi:hypothetical protein